jgi:sortase A
MRKKAIVALALALTGIVLVGDGTYLYAKAQLAQFLLERAWQQTLDGAGPVKPWSWADTWPVAKISFPGQQKSYIVLAGASGRTMAFGPGHVDGTAAPDQGGNCAIAGHRDTQFDVLRELSVGDTIELQTRDGIVIRYRVEQTVVLDRRDTSVLEPSSDRRLTLITCWPFDAINPGGNERYAVIASAM